MPRRQSVTSEQEKHRIMRVAARLFAEEGYDGVGTSQIARAAGLGKGSLYYHIGSKGDLLHGIMTVYLHDLCEDGRGILARNPEAAGRIRDLSESLIRSIVDHNSEMIVCFRELHALDGAHHSEVKALRRAYFDIWCEAMEAGARAGRFRDLDDDETKAVLGMYFYGVLWIEPTRQDDIPVLSRKFADLVLAALQPGPDPAA